MQIFRASLRLLAAVLLCVLLSSAVLFSQAEDPITAAVSWVAEENALVVPYINDSGIGIIYYLEVSFTSLSLLVRNANGTILKEYREVSQIAECPSPSGTIVFNRSPHLLLFCGERLFYYSVPINLQSNTLRLNVIQVVNSFYPKYERNPQPMVLKRGATTQTRDDVAIAVAGGETKHCIGMYGTSTSTTICQDDKITDFFLSSPAVPTANNPRPSTYLMVESTTSNNLRIDSYNVNSFTANVKPNATVTVTSNEENTMLRTNMNDENPGGPLLAYVQRSSERSYHILVTVINAKTLKIEKKGSLIAQFNDGEDNVLSAYMVKAGSPTYLIVQTPNLIGAIDYNALAEGSQFVWNSTDEMPNSGLIFTPVTHNPAWDAEVHRRQASASYTDYNPYHVIKASHVGYVSKKTMYRTLSLSDGSSAADTGPIDPNEELCDPSDTIAALRTGSVFDANMYLGCQLSGRYALVSLSLPAHYYVIKLSTVHAFSDCTFGYLDGPNSVTLTNGKDAVGFPLTPLLLYSGPVGVQSEDEFAAAYNAGRSGVLSLQKNNFPTFSLYSFDTTSDILGMSPMKPMMTFQKFFEEGSAVPDVTPFVAYFGLGKRYVAAAVTLQTVVVFSANDGSMVSKLNLTGCVENKGGEPSVLTFFKSVEHRGEKGDNYYVALGGTDSCVFELDDTLTSRFSYTVGAADNEFISTTQYSGYILSDNNKELKAYSNFFRENSALVYEIKDLASYVVGVNVFVFIKGDSISCRSVRTDTTVWSEKLPKEYTSTVKHMSYYNNTVFVVDENSYWQYNVQYMKGKKIASRVISSASVGTLSTPIISAKVDKGTVILLTAVKMHAFDAGKGNRLWEAPVAYGAMVSELDFSIVLYSPQDTGESNGESGSAYIEITAMGYEQRIVDLYSIVDGSKITSVSRTPNDITEQRIWKNTYVTHSKAKLKMVAFRSLNLPPLKVPEQVKRVPLQTTPVEVPGEPPLDPPQPPLPRGDLTMALSPPMTVTAFGKAALISEDRTRAVIAELESLSGKQKLTATCFKPNSTGKSVIRSWDLSEGKNLKDVNFIEFNSNYFIIQKPNSLQFYSWSDCKTVGSVQSTGIGTLALPSFISLPDQNRWIYRTGIEVISLKLPNEKEGWKAKVGSCSVIKLINNYVICYGGSSISILNSGSGAVVREDKLAGVVTSLESNFMGVSRTDRGYAAVLYSASGEVRTLSIDIPKDVGKVLAALPGGSSTNIIAIFERLVASINFETSEAPSAVVKWSNTMNGEVAQLGAAAYLGDSKSTLVIGTSNGVIILKPLDGLVIANISLPRKYKEDANAIQYFKVITIDQNIYGVLWNGFALVVHVEPLRGTATASFAFGNGIRRATLLSRSEGFILMGSGNMAGAVPVNAKVWGSPMAHSIYGLSDKDSFLAGWDTTNNTEVILRAVSGSRSTVSIIPDSVVYGSALVHGYAVFFAKETISSIRPNGGKGMIFTMPDRCTDTSYHSFHQGDGSGSMTLLLYSNNKANKGCTFLVGRNGAPPTHLSSLNQVYKSAANVRYGKNFALVVSEDLVVYGYDGSVKNTARGINAKYVSSISSPSTGAGIFVASTADTLICYQVKDFLEVWSYTLNTSSLRPVTYYNESIFVSTESGPYRLLLAEFGYPCRDRMEFHVKRTGNGKMYSKVEVNAPYGIGYVSTRDVFYAFDTSTGRVLWERPDLVSITKSKVIKQGKLLVAAGLQGGIFLNPFTGETILSFLSAASSEPDIFTIGDTSVAFGGTMTTVVNLIDYASYFEGIKPNRPSVSTPPYKPYNYNPYDKPNSCDRPAALPITLLKGREWVLGQKDMPKTPQSFAGTRYWIATLWKSTNVSQLVLDRADRGTFVHAGTGLVEQTSCEGINLFSLSATKVLVGIRCGGQTIFYDGTGSKVGKSNLIAKNDKCAVIGSNGYFMNKNNRVDGVDLKNFKRLPRASAQVECKHSAFNLISMPKSERIMLICPGVGIKMVQYASLNQLGSTINAPKGSDFSSYDFNDRLGVSIACGNKGSTVFMVAFTYNAKRIVTESDEASGPAVCGIVQDKGKKPQFVFAYANTIMLWPISGGNSTSETINDFNPIVAGSEGIVYTTGSNDYLLRKYDTNTSTILLEDQGVSTGHIAVRSEEDTLSNSVMIFGEGFSFAVDTSSGTVYWTGVGNYGNIYATSAPFVYALRKNIGLRSYYMATVKFAISGYARVTPAEVGGKAVVFVSQPGSLGCMNLDGIPLWNVAFANRDSPRIAFAPVVLDKYGYVLASGGGRAAAILKKDTGEVLKSFFFSMCDTSPDTSEANVIINGTAIYITMQGWSCTHIVDVSAVTKPALRIVETLKVAGAARGLRPGSPIFARVGHANHFVYVAQDPSDKGKNVITVYRISSSPKERTKLWSASLPSDFKAVSTYGYILYVSTKAYVSAYDLLSKRLAWTYNAQGEVLYPIVGADGLLYVSTVKGVFVIRSSINVPNSMREVARIDFPSPSPKGKAASAVRTPYGQILFSDGSKARAYQHLHSRKNFTELWSASGYNRILTSFGGKFNSIATIDASEGTGILDLSSGEVRWLSDQLPSLSMTLAAYATSLRNTPLICSFVSMQPNCRLLPDEFIKPTGTTTVYKYDPEPLEVVPPGWSPIVDGVQPTDFCKGRMKIHIPEFTLCMKSLTLAIYPKGRASIVDCPNDFVPVQNCMKHLNPLVQECPDVVSYISSHYNQQTKDAQSAVGLCDTEEAKKRCNTTVARTLDQTCTLVTMALDVNGYQTPPGYDIGYSLPVFSFEVEEPVKNIGAIFGGIAAAVIIISIIIGILLFLRRKRKERDTRFFDDDDETSVPFRKDFDKESNDTDVPMLDIKKPTPPPASNGSEFSLDTASHLSLPQKAAVPAVGPQKFPPKMPGRAPVSMPGKKGPKNPPPAGLQSIMDDDI